MKPPGRAEILPCRECAGRGFHLPGACCNDCGGTGKHVQKACPACGDPEYEHLGNGSYACRGSCTYRWSENDPGWQAQRLPELAADISWSRRALELYFQGDVATA